MVIKKPKENRNVDTSKIVVKNSLVHGKGVFAARDIKKGEQVIEYVGEILTKAQSDKRADEQLEKSYGNENEGSVYIFELNKKYDIDGNVSWNPARLINHSCDPNCETEGDDDHVWIEAMRDIKKGEELSYDYCFDIDNWEDHPCLCGSNKCVGFIVNQKKWKLLREKIRRKKQREKRKRI